MERNIRLVLAYDGTEFHGWQRQPGLRTVQETIEQAARRVVRHQVALTGSGRTDAGVHARGQVANFLTTGEIPLTSLARAIGSRLPKDISLVGIGQVPLGFRASQHAISKLYRYTVHNDAHRPVERHRQRYAYHFWNRLDIQRMQAAARFLVGEHDFVAFARRGAERESTVRTVLRCEVYRHYNDVYLDVEGTGFLYNQVRNMTGTLLEVGRGHWKPERVAEILASRNRSNAGPTAPARGLCLQWVRYNLAGEFSPPDTPDRDEQPSDLLGPQPDACP